MIKFYREWAMPSRHTFTIKPIAELLIGYNVGKNWIDPFAGENSPAEVTNDLNPDKPTMYHLHAKDFAEQLSDPWEGCLFDPPYSLRQVRECYDQIGISLLTQEDTNYFPNNVKKILAPKIAMGGVVVSFGWNSQGFGIKLGFDIIEILLVPHGGKHNDTIVTVEKKVKHQTEMF